MRCRLEHLDVTGVDLQFGSEQRRATLRAAVEVRGELVQDGPRLEISDASARRCEVTGLLLAIGTVTISADTSIVLDELRGGFRRLAEHVTCELTAATAQADRLSVVIDDVAVSGRIELVRPRLRIDGADGVVLADRVVISELSVTVAGAQISVPRVEGVQVVVAWGHDGLRIEAASIDLASGAIEATLTAPPTAPASAPAPAAPASEPAPAPAAPASETAPWRERVDDALRLLDGLSGEVNADLALDLTVPVLGRRRATHRFRIPIADGELDYIRLENDLSTLENALLDFVVRDGGLVLEMGIPFLPTRGLGKPILRWDLGADDLALAQRQRIRLAMLPRFRDASGETSRPSRVALRQLELRDLDATLRLELAAPPARLPIRRLGELKLAGGLYHDLDTAPREGALRGQLAELEVGAMTLALGANHLMFQRASLALAEDLEVAFVGVQPRSARLRWRGLVIDGLRLAPASTSPGAP